jgi:uncharacterized protein with HEPN domain
MYKRDVRLYLDDIDESIAAIEEFTSGLDYDSFAVRLELPLLKIEVSRLRQTL